MSVNFELLKIIPKIKTVKLLSFSQYKRAPSKKTGECTYYHV